MGIRGTIGMPRADSRFHWRLPWFIAVGTCLDYLQATLHLKPRSASAVESVLPKRYQVTAGVVVPARPSAFRCLMWRW
jgi:hypothetical protein